MINEVKVNMNDIETDYRYTTVVDLVKDKIHILKSY